MRRARLNLFQAAMLRWRELHPYCAAHVIAVPAPLEPQRLRAVIAGVLEDCALTGFVLDARRRRFGFAGGPASVDLRVLEPAGDPFDVAAAEIAHQINRPFPAEGAFDPLRFHAVPDGERCLVGLVYDHVLAGGDSIAVLMTDVAARYAAADPAQVALPRLDLPRRTYRGLLLRRAGDVLRGLAWLPGLVRGWRSAVRPRLADPGDGRNGFVHFGVAAAAYARLRGRAKRLGISTNDLLLACVMAAVAPLAGPRDPARRRHALAVATIVNLRDEFQPPATATFGQFLSSLRVVHPFPEGAALDDVARDLGAQAATGRRARLHYLTLLGIALAGLLWRFASLSKRQRLYLKYHPVFAGITPLNVDALRRHGTGSAGDYLRAASTGPMSPLVVALTTSGAALRVGITYRTTAVDDARAAEVAQALRRTIEAT